MFTCVASPPKEKRIQACDVPIGVIVQIPDEPLAPYAGHYVLRVDDYVWADLSEPCKNWTKSECTLSDEVIVLPPGTILTLAIKEDK